MYDENFKPLPGWENDIMANPWSGWPSERDINNILKENKDMINKGPICQ
jgi:hypothetical protein